MENLAVTVSALCCSTAIVLLTCIVLKEVGKKPTEKQEPTRPCLVDGEPAEFHRWIEESKALLKINTFLLPEDQIILRRRFDETDVVPHGCGTEVVRQTLALVEYPDGSVGKVKPELVEFTDKGGEQDG